MIRLVRISVMCAAMLALSAAPALAAHTHVTQVGNDRCVILAQNGGEENVVLPLSVFLHNPNVDIAAAADRMHPLHVLVHKGVPGDHNSLAVFGTAAGDALCAAGYVGNN
ncbi:MAG: hypothetical protein ABIP77_07570 [Candidatus Limnocylindrales bacterium]